MSYQPDFPRGWSVIVKNYVDIFNEHKASAAIIPGTFLRIGADLKVAPGGADDLPFAGVAVSDDLFGNRNLNTPYAVDDLVKVWTPTRGDEVRAVFTGAITAGSYVKANASGIVESASAGDAGVVGVALEAGDTAVASDTYPRIIVRIL